MILQNCHGEGIFELNEKSNALKSLLVSESRFMRSDLVSMYSGTASAIEDDVKGKVDSLPGWIADELNLTLARQRLDNLRLI
ncbi:hypothetical protein [Burkholderia ubonensis]|uniref:hypothetical protein n=1 Tax=Burkholderia ubonensis TaxID=101571 RepID=UPI0018DED498|nr:hypothetical protein [Burkholderia ubonensis]